MTAKRSDQGEQDRKHNEGIGHVLESGDSDTCNQCDDPVFTRH